MRHLRKAPLYKINVFESRILNQLTRACIAIRVCSKLIFVVLCWVCAASRNFLLSSRTYRTATYMTWYLQEPGYNYHKSFNSYLSYPPELSIFFNIVQLRILRFDYRYLHITRCVLISGSTQLSLNWCGIGFVLIWVWLGKLSGMSWGSV